MARKRRAAGGRTTLYNAKGSPAAASATDETSDGFKRGGKARKDGGAIGGMASGGNLAKRARGGSVPGRAHGGSVSGMKSAGGSPFSSGRSVSGGEGKQTDGVY